MVPGSVPANQSVRDGELPLNVGLDRIFQGFACFISAGLQSTLHRDASCYAIFHQITVFFCRNGPSATCNFS